MKRRTRKQILADPFSAHEALDRAALLVDVFSRRSELVTDGAPIGSRKSRGNLRLRLSFLFLVAFMGRRSLDTGFDTPSLTTSCAARSWQDGQAFLSSLHSSSMPGDRPAQGGVAEAPIRNSLAGFMRISLGVAHIQQGSFTDQAALSPGGMPHPGTPTLDPYFAALHA